DADVTASSVNAADGPLNDDLNDDGLADAEDLDEDNGDGDTLEDLNTAVDPDRALDPGETYESGEEEGDDNLPGLLQRQAVNSDLA
ncbi:MAG: hypothetical protein B7Z31_14780, partial [Rhodobacterales bacterium 12-65-15]